MKQGRGLERLVAHLERILVNDPSVKIHSPKKFPDLVTGRLREHDVVLEIATGHHINFVALECRERSRPVGVNQVEAFSKKCEHTGISKGILVSQKGFYKSALLKASALKIGCFTLEQVTELTTGNLLMSFQTFTFLNTNIEDIRFEFVQADNVVRKPGQYQIMGLDGELVSRDRVRQNAISAFKSLPPEFDKIGERGLPKAPNPNSRRFTQR
ncbi:MAG TPA: restriction endonuclease [Pyrinomonadaceae bacterium]|jgi:hypothetical protein|nr:restriction endonuclease [Pyrinomonadaceae bacterium]